MTETVTRKFEQSYAVWFQPSKSFVLLEEPAYEVFRLNAEGKDRNEITKICRIKFGHLEENIPQFVSEIIQQLAYFNNPENAVTVSVNPPEPKPGSSILTKTYKMGNKTISVNYRNEYLQFALHPVFSHLEITYVQEPEHLLELFENSKILFFGYNGKMVDAFSKKNIEYFTGSVKQQIYSILYNRGFNYWMMALHASGVVQNRQAILFSAAGGAGKSTIAALLKVHGYGYVSDDFIAADTNGEVYPFPAAISVKEGAAETLSVFYHELKAKNSELAFTGKQVRYIPVHNLKEMDAAPYPVKALVFVNFNRSVPFVFEKVNKKEALQLLLKETWVNPLPEKVSCFFDWIENTSFYRLQYSRTEQALESVNKLFKS